MVRSVCAVSGVAIAVLLLAGGCPSICSPDCAEKECGDDGCGGSCGACAETHDCLAQACVVRPTCTDGLKNGLEVDVDCGGPGCPGCADGRACVENTDCASGRCEAGRCTSCVDGVRNGQESDVDCAGDCRPCDDGRVCREPSDCASGRCDGEVCGSCQDGLPNGTEVDVDCGGSCEPCRQGRRCLDHPDCASRTCLQDVCEDPTCSDAVLNQDETDLDCGGARCAPCALGLICVRHTDCEPGACFDERCAVAECHRQRDCGDVVNDLEAKSCIDKLCVAPWAVDGEGRPVRREVQVNLVFAQVFAVSQTKPRTVVMRVVNPVRSDGSRLDCAALKVLSGATQATRSNLEENPDVNLIYRNLLSLEWGPNQNTFDFRETRVPKVEEAIVYAEAWWGPRSSMMPTGNRASATCLEGVRIAELATSVRVDFSP